MDYFTSDWHIDHKNVIHFSNRPFSSIGEMNQTILDNMFSVMKRGDSLYFLGDLTFSKDKALEILQEFKRRGIRFYWILGNHDLSLRPKNFKDYCQIIEPLYLYKGDGIRIHLCHFPMRTWYRSFDNTYHLYGHIHENSIEKGLLQDVAYGKSLNVNVEFNNYMPYSLKDIKIIMADKPDNIDFASKEKRDGRREIRRKEESEN